MRKALLLILALIIALAIAIPVMAAPDAKKTPAWIIEGFSAAKAQGQAIANVPGIAWNRGNASGEKITSNAHSTDYDGIYFEWDEKQKDPGVLLIREDVFDLFVGETFKVTAKNSSTYYGYQVAKAQSGNIVSYTDGLAVYGYVIPKQVQNDKGKSEDLKNINMIFIDGTYKPGYFDITKNWYDEEGNQITNEAAIAELNKLLKLNDKYQLGANEVKFADFTTAQNGRKVTVTENAIAGYTLLDGTTNSYTVTVKHNLRPVVEFNNKKLWAEITIAKKWLNNDGEAVNQPENLEAMFKIIGASVSASKLNVPVGTYNVKEGRYVITENDVNGYDLVDIEGLADDGSLVAAAGGKYTVAFTNQDPSDPLKSSKLTLRKMVSDDGLKANIVDWLIEKGYIADIFDVLNDITFELYTSDEGGNAGALAAAGTLDSESVITFSPEVGTGWYLVHEVLGDIASAVFDEAGDLLLYYNADSEIATGNSSEFDYDAFYTIVNGYSGRYIRTLGYPGLNNSGDVFYIGVTNTATGEEYPSYCAHSGSKNFAGDNHLGCKGYLVAGKSMPDEPGAAPYAAFIAALNFIEDEYGNLNDNRVITQTVIWVLLDAIDVDSEAFAGANLTDAEKDAVKAACAAAADGYAGKGAIVDLVYLLCETHRDDFEYCQPQLVPVYGGEVVFNNKPNNNPLKEDVFFQKVKYDGLLPINKLDEFGFKLYRFNEETGSYDDYIVTYYTDADGNVPVGKLDPGKYVFKEIRTLFWSESPDNDDSGAFSSYNLVWKPIYPGNADGLYFMVNNKGETVWDVDLNGQNHPVVNNVLYCKHHVLWGAGDDFYFSYDYDLEKCGDGNVIIFKDYCDKCFEVQDVVEPSCERAGIIWLGCPDGCTGTGVEFGERLEHNFVPVAIAPGYGNGYVWFGCTNGCGGSYVEYDRDAWFELDGPAFDEIEYIALAPGYGDGCVWFVNHETGENGVALNKDAWHALGGADLACDNMTVALAPGYGDGWVWKTCLNEWCGKTIVEYDKDAWLALGGYDFAEYTAIALAPGYGNGYVWIVYNDGSGRSDVVYDKSAWLALGGDDFAENSGVAGGE